MKINKTVLTTIFFSIILYAEVTQDSNPFDSLTVKEESKYNSSENNSSENNSSENNSTIALEKLKSELKKKLIKRNFSFKDIKNKRFLKRFYRQNTYTPLWLTKDGINERYKQLFNEIDSDITLDTESRIYKEYQKLAKYIEKEDTLYT